MGLARHWTTAVVAIAATAGSGVLVGQSGATPALTAMAAAAAGLVGAAVITWLYSDEAPGPGAGATGDAAGGIAPGVTGHELLANLPLALILLDGAGKLHFGNDAATDLFGPVRHGEPLSSIIRSPALAETVATAAAGGIGRSVEFTHMRAREQRVLLAHLRPVAGGAARGEASMMILVEDHTRLAAIEQMRGDFIANASHELRTPLAAIAGFIETLQGPASEDSAARARFLPIMAREAERMARLVDDLMSLNRIELNAHLRPSGTVDLGELVHQTAAAVTPLAEAAGVRVELAVQPAGLEVSGDRDELSQLFVNLIDNAIKHGGGGGLVRVEQAPQEPGRGRMHGITIADNGAGIERRHIPRLTERFYRVMEARSAAQRGTGLGLSIVQQILNHHRGDLTIRSAPGEGARFTVWLPRATDAIAAK